MISDFWWLQTCKKVKDIYFAFLEIDLLPGFVCFFVGLLYELEMGIFTGVGTHLLIVLYNSARPRVRVEIKQVKVYIHILSNIFSKIFFPEALSVHFFMGNYKMLEMIYILTQKSGIFLRRVSRFRNTWLIDWLIDKKREIIFKCF